MKPAARAKGGRGERERLRVGGITIARLARGKLFLVNAAGEGMATSEAKLGRVVSEYFEREF